MVNLELGLIFMITLIAVMILLPLVDKLDKKITAKLADRKARKNKEEDYFGES